VDNPFMAGAAPYPAWLAKGCSFFDQIGLRKTGAWSTAAPLCGAASGSKCGEAASPMPWPTSIFNFP